MVRVDRDAEDLRQDSMGISFIGFGSGRLLRRLLARRLRRRCRTVVNLMAGSFASKAEGT